VSCNETFKSSIWARQIARNPHALTWNLLS